VIGWLVALLQNLGMGGGPVDGGGPPLTPPVYRALTLTGTVTTARTLAGIDATAIALTGTDTTARTLTGAS
jgi:hypothetical protein